MDIQALDNLTPTATAVIPARPSGDTFAARMKAEQARAAEAIEGHGLSAERSEQLRTAAEQLVAISFIQPMLAKMRDDPFKSDLFHGGRGEEVFGQQLDVIYADRIVSRSDFSIVDAVYDSIARSAARIAGTGTEIDQHA